MISGRSANYLACRKPNTLTKNSLFQPCIHLTFNTHLHNPTLFIKTPSGSFRSRPNATINDLYLTESNTESFYDLLGISECGSLLEIKQAYKQLVRQYHPDVSPPERTEEYTRRFIEVQEAYETLSDPSRKALYDKDLAKGLLLAFSARKQFHYDQRLDKRSEWKNQWQSQLTELESRRMNKKDSRKNMSWVAQMRQQRFEASDCVFY